MKQTHVLLRQLKGPMPAGGEGIFPKPIGVLPQRKKGRFNEFE